MKEEDDEGDGDCAADSKGPWIIESDFSSLSSAGLELPPLAPAAPAAPARPWAAELPDNSDGGLGLARAALFAVRLGESEEEEEDEDEEEEEGPSS